MFVQNVLVSEKPKGCLVKQVQLKQNYSNNRMPSGFGTQIIAWCEMLLQVEIISSQCKSTKANNNFWAQF